MSGMQDEFPPLQGPITPETLQTMELPQCVDIWELELPEAVTALALTPKGKLAAAATLDDAIVVVDTETGEEKSRLSGHVGGTNALAFLSGSVLASAGEDGTVRLWNIGHSECVGEWKIDGVDADRTPHGACVNHISVAPGGTHFAAAAGRTMVLFAVSATPATAATVTRRDFDPLKSTVEALRFDKKQGNLLAGYNGGVTVVDLANRAADEAQSLDFPYDGACLSVDGNATMEWVVSGCHDASVHIWQLIHNPEGAGKGAGVEVKEMACGGYERPVKFVDFDGNGRFLASAGGKQGIIWDFKESPTGSVPTLTLGHSGAITAQAWQPDEPFLLATGDKNGTVLFHDVEDIAEEGQPNLCL